MCYEASVIFVFPRTYTAYLPRNACDQAALPVRDGCDLTYYAASSLYRCSVTQSCGIKAVVLGICS